MAPEFCEIYSRLGVEYRLPILLTSTFAAYSPNDNLAGVTEATFRPGVELARARGFRLFDAAIQTTWARAESAPVEAPYKALVDSIAPGRLTFFCLHFNAPGELDAIEPEAQHIRIQEYELFRSRGFGEWLAAQDLDVIGMRPLRDELRGVMRAQAV